MNLHITLEKDDFLNYQLFTASKSPSVKKTMQKYQIHIPIAYVILATLVIVLDNIATGVVFLAVGVLWYFFSIRWLKKKYYKHYDKFVKERFANRFGEEGKITVEGEQIVSEDSSGESKVNLDALEEINETGSHFFIKLKTGESFIFPKEQVQDDDSFSAFIQTLKTKYHIRHNQELQWSWK